MTDFGLDDLIKQDKEKRKNKQVAKKAAKSTGPRRRAQITGNPKKQPKNRLDNRRNHQKDRSSPQEARQQTQPRSEGRRLRVMGLHPDISSTNLFELFNKHGALDVCKVDQDNFGRSLTTATVIYHSEQHAQAAQRELNQSKVMNSTITVQIAKPRSIAPKTKKIFKKERSEGNFRPKKFNQGKNFKGKNFKRKGFNSRNQKN